MIHVSSWPGIVVRTTASLPLAAAPQEVDARPKTGDDGLAKSRLSEHRDIFQQRNDAEDDDDDARDLLGAAVDR
jgi:hypothetical protein